MAKERIKLQNFIRPMLAKETSQPFNSDDWIFEIKWDGYRAIAETGKQLRLYSRNGLSFNDKYPEVADALKKLKSNVVLDGEIVALDSKGNSHFQLLQNYDPGESMLVYYVFDILRKDGKDLTKLSLVQRKALLQKLITNTTHLRYSDHIPGEGIQFFKLIVKRDLEGIIAKRAESEYYPGVRTGEWLKIKNHKGQEAVIVGFTAPRKSRKFFGALVLGVYEGNELKYAGHTGTGFNDRTLKALYEKLKPLVRENSPFKERIKTNMPVTWVEPKLVGNIKFTEITKDGIMRQPVFLGLREDKEPDEVINEKKRLQKKSAKSR